MAEQVTRRSLAFIIALSVSVTIISICARFGISFAQTPTPHTRHASRTRYAWRSPGTPVNTTGWVEYRNAKTGLSFRYPPDFRIREVDPKGFPEDTETVTDVIGNPDPGLSVLRFIIHRGWTTPGTAAAKGQEMREFWRGNSEGTLTPMKLDGHEAFIQVFCGGRSGNCQWSVEILQPRECTILSFVTEPGFDAPSDDYYPYYFPVLSIIQTVHLELPKK